MNKSFVIKSLLPGMAWRAIATYIDFVGYRLFFYLLAFYLIGWKNAKYLVHYGANASQIFFLCHYQCCGAGAGLFS